jgi:hypothetical protein
MRAVATPVRDDAKPPHILALFEELAVLLNGRLAQRHAGARRAGATEG